MIHFHVFTSMVRHFHLRFILSGATITLPENAGIYFFIQDLFSGIFMTNFA